MLITYPLTIYYDASCPLCATEMHTLKETDFENKLILVDCSNQGFIEPTSCPVNKEAMMARIHAVDAVGRWIKGVDVFTIAYGASGYSKLSKIWGSQTLKPLLSRAYPWVADNRHWLSKTPLPYLFNRFLRACARL